MSSSFAFSEWADHTESAFFLRQQISLARRQPATRAASRGHLLDFVDSYLTAVQSLLD